MWLICRHFKILKQNLEKRQFCTIVCKKTFLSIFFQISLDFCRYFAFVVYFCRKIQLKNFQIKMIYCQPENLGRSRQHCSWGVREHNLILSHSHPDHSISGLFIILNHEGGSRRSLKSLPNKWLERFKSHKMAVRCRPEQNRVTWKTPSSRAFVPLQEPVGVLASYVPHTQMQV
jgi:hypothetical protein